MRTIPWTSNAALVLMLGMLLLNPVQAATFRAEREALRAGQALVEMAALGEIDAAFAQAAELSRPGDTEALARLDAQKRLVAERSEGGISALSRPEEAFFAGCLTRTYELRRSSGQRQFWRLKFRRGVAGWYLSDLNLRAS